MFFSSGVLEIILHSCNFRVSDPHRETCNFVGNIYVGFVPIGVTVGIGIDAWE